MPDLHDIDSLQARIASAREELGRLEAQLERRLGTEATEGTFEGLCVRAGERLFALRLDAVSEVVLRPSLRELPEAPPWVPGLLDLRGQTILVLDLLARIERGERDRELTDLVVVCRANGRPLALVVQEVLDVLQLGVETLQDPGTDLDATPYVTQLHRWNDQVVLQLDLPRLAHTSSLPDSLSSASSS